MTQRQAASAQGLKKLFRSPKFAKALRAGSRGKLFRSQVAPRTPNAGLYLQCQKAKEMGVKPDQAGACSLALTGKNSTKRLCKRNSESLKDSQK